MANHETYWGFLLQMKVGEQVIEPEIGYPDDHAIKQAFRYYRKKHKMNFSFDELEDDYGNSTLVFIRTA